MSDTIGVHAAPVAERLRQAVEPTLTDEERTRIGRRIGTALAATALLIVGTIYAKVLPDQTAVADLLLFVGAIIAAVPLFSAALHGVGCPACSHLREAPKDHEHGAEACSADAGEQEHHSGGIMDQLVSIAVLAAIATGEYETAILVPLLMAIGHFLEERSLLGARAAIDGLKRLRAEHATRINDGVEQTVPIDDLAVGDVLVIRPGEILSADGTVTEGHSAVDQSSVTGETVPEDVAPGSAVFAGTGAVQPPRKTGPAANSGGEAAPRKAAPYQYVTLPVPEAAAGDSALLELPVSSRSKLDKGWLSSVPFAVPESVVQSLQQRGHEVRRQRHVIPYITEDGRPVVFPVDEVQLQYVGNRDYQ